MKHCPLISIIIPAYNSERYLEECVLSIESNTYKNIEIIIVNDGSTDGTLEKALKLKADYKNITVFSKINGGLSAARNDGIKLASGDVIGFVDSDDVVDLNYLIKLIEPIIQNNADFSYCLFERFKHFAPKKTTRDVTNKIFVQTKDDYLSNENHVEKVISCAKLFKKNILDSIKFEVGRYHEDEFFYNQIINNSNIKTIGYINERLYYYRENADGIMLSNSNFDKKKYDALDSFFERLDFLKKYGLCKADNRIQKVIDDILLFTTSHNWEKPFKKERIRYLRRGFLKAFSTKRGLKQKIKCIFGLIFPILFLFYFSPLTRSNIKNRLLLKTHKNKTILYLGSITHGNLGDHAILLGARKFFKEKGYRLIDLTKDELTPDVINLINSKRFPIGLRGGGNIGNIWIQEEEFHRAIIKQFPSNKIFFFPESIFFTNSTEGKQEEKISSEIYASKKDLIIFVRDELSFKRAKTIFYNQVEYCPDMALYLKSNYYCPHKLKKCLIILRNDCESNVDSELSFVLENVLKKGGFNIEYGSTIDGDYIKKSQSKKKVMAFIKKIKRYDLIITDRLHGMIFSYDTGTPCIVLDNNNGKVKSVATMLEKSKIVSCLEDYSPEKISQIISQFESAKENVLDYKNQYNSLLDHL